MIMIFRSCSCLFDGNIRQNTKKLQSLMRSYQQIYEELAKYFSRGDFVVETVPALINLPPQIRYDWSANNILHHHLFN